MSVVKLDRVINPLLIVLIIIIYNVNTFLECDYLLTSELFVAFG